MEMVREGRPEREGRKEGGRKREKSDKVKDRGKEIQRERG